MEAIISDPSEQTTPTMAHLSQTPHTPQTLSVTAFDSPQPSPAPAPPLSAHLREPRLSSARPKSPSRDQDSPYEINAGRWSETNTLVGEEGTSSLRPPEKTLAKSYYDVDLESQRSIPQDLSRAPAWYSPGPMQAITRSEFFFGRPTAV